MKILFLLILIFTLTSCGVDINFNRYNKPHKGYSNTSFIDLYSINNDYSVGDLISKEKFEDLDNIDIFGKLTMLSNWSGISYYYMIKVKNKEVYVSLKDILPNCNILIRDSLSNTLILPIENENLYWSRVSFFVNKFSTTPIFRNKNNVIESTNFYSDLDQRVFLVTKEKIDNKNIRITFNCNKPLYNAFGCYYVLKGEICE